MAARPNLPDTDGSKEQLILPSETDAVTKDNQLEKAVIDSADQGSAASYGMIVRKDGSILCMSYG
ncbi:hypothetical protein A0J61_06449 [Choanephora cucurbitarum]|uniref:Uncharacterized protein n=1 Tax=Choanephora cucurbitarum TaxID=101091 RepID=A0A1C7N8P0_9FUNG|nr:hypothetical protein A0J61_06449 [Choanephora cucurbitarum]